MQQLNRFLLSFQLLILGACVSPGLPDENSPVTVQSCGSAALWATLRHPCVVRKKDWLQHVSESEFASILDADADSSTISQYLLQYMPDMLDAVIGPVNSTVFYFSSTAPLAKLVNFRPKHDWGPLPLRQLMASSEAGWGARHYASVPFTSLPDKVSKDLQSLFTPLLFDGQQRDGDGSSSSGGGGGGGSSEETPRGALWLTSPGVTAASHFDSSSNLLIQLAGQKHVALAPAALPRTNMGKATLEKVKDIP